MISIANVCDDEGYWSTVDELSGGITDFLSNRCDNLKNAIENYATYLDLSAATDLSILPIVWPDGAYGLHKPTDGCPSDTNGFSYSSGWVKQKPYKNSHKYSDNHHFEGTLTKSTAQYYFCMKNVEQANTIYRQSWPAGSYCLYKSSETTQCPTDFAEGSIKWRDRDNKNERSNNNLPDGEYSRDKTLIKYCCRDDGGTSDEIYLPTGDPFYLIRKGDECQAVSGMTVTTDTMKIRSKKSGGETSGNIPSVEGNPYKLFYCYYS